VCRHQSVGQNYNLPIAYKYFEDVAKFKYLRITVTSRNCIDVEIKNILNLEKALLPFFLEILVFCLQT
jgi:hypothetical protein